MILMNMRGRPQRVEKEIGRGTRTGTERGKGIRKEAEIEKETRTGIAAITGITRIEVKGWSIDMIEKIMIIIVAEIVIGTKVYLSSFTYSSVYSSILKFTSTASICA